MRFGMGSIVAILVIAWDLEVVSGATIYVDGANVCPGTGSVGDPYCSIQAGIDAAVSGVDEVVVALGTYNEIIDFVGKAITVRSELGPAVTTIEGGGYDSGVVRFRTGELATSVLEGVTVTNGEAVFGGKLDTFLGNVRGGHRAPRPTPMARPDRIEMAVSMERKRLGRELTRDELRVVIQELAQIDAMHDREGRGGAR